jgi:hypothetical protein
MAANIKTSWDLLNRFAGQVRYPILLYALILSLCSCQKKIAQFNGEDPFFDAFKKEFVIMTPSPYCKGCLVNTLRMMRENFSAKDYIIVSPREPLVSVREERFKKLSTETYQGIMGQNTSVWVIYNGSHNSFRQEMKAQEDFEVLKNFIDRGWGN